MKNLEPLLASSFTESVDFRSTIRDVQGESMTCPHCEALCQALGKVRNNWYALCKCGTYIQMCARADDYYD